MDERAFVLKPVAEPDVRGAQLFYDPQAMETHFFFRFAHGPGFQGLAFGNPHVAFSKRPLAVGIPNKGDVRTVWPTRKDNTARGNFHADGVFAFAGLSAVPPLCGRR